MHPFSLRSRMSLVGIANDFDRRPTFTSTAMVCRALFSAALMTAWHHARAQERLPAPTPQSTMPQAAGRAAGSQRALTLADLEGIALANNPTLAQASAAIEQERGMWEQAGLYPTLSPAI